MKEDRKLLIQIIFSCLLLIIVSLIIDTQIINNDNLKEVNNDPKELETKYQAETIKETFGETFGEPFGEPFGETSLDGEFWCMGKNDTCQNKTSNALDLYCGICDPDGDNIEN